MVHLQPPNHNKTHSAPEKTEVGHHSYLISYFRVQPVIQSSYRSAKLAGLPVIATAFLSAQMCCAILT